MANITWQKTGETAQSVRTQANAQKRLGYLVVGLALLGVVAYLVINGMATGRYYMTVDDLMGSAENMGKNVRVAGAVDGETIHFDPETQILTFTVVNIPNDADTIQEQGGLGEVLHKALQDPTVTRMEIVWHNAEMPDLLQHEAQAIMTGKLGEDGKFYAEEVLLKCPTRYSDEAPKQTAVE